MIHVAHREISDILLLVFKTATCLLAGPQTLRAALRECAPDRSKQLLFLVAHAHELRFLLVVVNWVPKPWLYHHLVRRVFILVLSHPHSEDEATALVDAIGEDVDPAVIRLDQVLADHQPEADAIGVLVRGPLQLAELVEKLLVFVLRNPFATVDNVHLKLLLGSVEGAKHLDGALFREF